MGDSSPSLHVAGVPVHFPYTPYRAQNALMHAVVTSIRNAQHALVESPTGTGKSLALLCSSLAMQHHLTNLQNPQPAPNPHPHAPATQSPDVMPQHDPPEHSPKPLSFMCHNLPDSDDSDFAPRKRFRDVSWQKPVTKHRKQPGVGEQPANAFMIHRLIAERDNPLDTSDQLQSEQHPFDPSQPTTKHIPRIFYGTRTHNQVAQVITELRKTVYRPRMSILASRREYCIREEVRSSTTCDETCKSLVKDNACQLYHNAALLASHDDLRDEAWDIEELNELGNKHGGCPYYASHELYQSAQLILCPYSFLVDPIVRNARGVNLSGDVVILDEAHNIESFAREAAGFQIDVADLRRAANGIEEMITTGSLPFAFRDLVNPYRKIKAFLECFLSLTDDVTNSARFQEQGNAEHAIYERRELLQTLATAAVTTDQVRYWRASHEFIVNFGDGNDAKRLKKMERYQPILESSQSQLSNENSCSKLGHAPADSEENVVTSQQQQYGYGGGGLSTTDATADEVPANPDRERRGRRPGKGRKRSRQREESVNEQTPWVMRALTIAHSLLTTLEYLFENPDDFTMVVDRRTIDYTTVVRLQLHCLNAAVCFREVSSKARSVIVTSGTLSPVTSFAGELGTRFATVKTLPHVIDVRKQLFVGIAGEGPRRVVFDATFLGSAKFAFQDSLGDALVDYCRVIPGGVLTFFPSYRMMEQLRRRWMSSGVLERLAQVKGAVLFEPNKRGEEFDSVVSAYHTASSAEGSGAVLMGVCRGKFSEGIDFRDSTSRAVIVIGIPFPYRGDPVVDRKKCWNDRTRAEQKRSELQSGMDWYEMQAFRALNQALGRTVRHRYDYGAILLMDCRYRLKRTGSLLPGWTGEAMQSTRWPHHTLVDQLRKFYDGIQDRIATIAEEDRKFFRTQ